MRATLLTVAAVRLTRHCRHWLSYRSRHGECGGSERPSRRTLGPVSQISSRRMRGGVIGKDLRALLFGTVYRRWNFAENTRMVPRTAHITRRLMNSLAFIEPRFLCTQTPKHTVSLKRPKYTLCEKKFRYELKLGRESTNPTFKGTPQPPL